jgi:hypothetical protein
MKKTKILQVPKAIRDDQPDSLSEAERNTKGSFMQVESDLKQKNHLLSRKKSVQTASSKPAKSKDVTKTRPASMYGN